MARSDASPARKKKKHAHSAQPDERLENIMVARPAFRLGERAEKPSTPAEKIDTGGEKIGSVAINSTSGEKKSSAGEKISSAAEAITSGENNSTQGEKNSTLGEKVSTQGEKISNAGGTISTAAKNRPLEKTTSSAGETISTAAKTRPLEKTTSNAGETLSTAAKIRPLEKTTNSAEKNIRTTAKTSSARENISTKAKTSTPGEKRSSATAKTSTPGDKNITHVVIIGCGIIGLAIAYHLSADAARNGLKMDIKVVEIAAIIKHASARCVGIYNKSRCPPEVQHLVHQSAWTGIQNRAQDRLVSNNVLQPPDGTGAALIELPAWYRGKPNARLVSKPSNVAKLNTSELIMVLSAACRESGVQFHMNSQVCKASTSEHGITAVAIQRNDEDMPKWYACDNLVLAAGPWTKGICNDLFMKNTLLFQDQVFAANWLVLGMKAPYPEQDVGVLADSSSFAFMTDVRAASRPGGQIIVAGVVPQQVRAPDRKEAFGERRASPTRALAAWSRAFLTPALFKAELDADTYQRGTEFICYADPQRQPCIAAIQMRGLDPVYADSSASSGVWLCYGFGMHGTFLAPGVGAMISKDILSSGRWVASNEMSKEAVQPQESVAVGDLWESILRRGSVLSDVKFSVGIHSDEIITETT